MSAQDAIKRFVLLAKRASGSLPRLSADKRATGAHPASGKPSGTQPAFDPSKRLSGAARDFAASQRSGVSRPSVGASQRGTAGFDPHKRVSSSARVHPAATQPTSVRSLAARLRQRVYLQRAALVLLAAAFALPLVLFVLLRSGADVLGEVRVRGHAVARGASGAQAVRNFAVHWQEENVSLQAGPFTVRYTRAQLGASLPSERVCARLLTLGHTGVFSEDFAAFWVSHRGGLDLSLAPEIELPLLGARLADLRKRFERPPVPGMIMSDGNVLPGIPGFTIDFAAAIQTMEDALRSDATSVQLDVRSLAPPDPLVYGAGNDSSRFTLSMVGYETTYRTGGASAGRAHNIEMAAARLEGMVMDPGRELSFNQVVGERSYAQGFAVAKEIAYKRVVDGVGGGVCQVAATLHAVAFLGGFKLTEYRPHSRPAHYIDIGLDTMVSWPDKDMRIANPYPFPVRVRARAHDGVLQIWLEGSAKPHVVEWSTQIVSRVKAGSQELPDDSLGPGQSELLQEAIDGLTVRRVRTVYLPSGAQREDEMLRYPPNDRIVMVGAGSRHSRTARATSGDTPDQRAQARLALEDF